MKTRVQRLGSDVAIRIPKAFVEELGLRANDEVEITLRHGEIIIALGKTKAYSLDELLEAVTDNNRPDEWDMESAIGKESW